MNDPGLRHLHAIGRTILRPALTLIGALAALATVGAVAAVALPSHGHARPSANPVAAPKPAAVRAAGAPAATPPAGGLPGEIIIDGEGANGNNGYISIDQCTVCFNARKDNDRAWLLSTTDGGASWRVKRSRWQFDSPDPIAIAPVSWAGKNGWTTAFDQRSKHGDERLLVTHDGGVTWTPTGPTDAVQPSVSVAGGFVWALGLCEAVSCQLQRGPASGSRLTDVSAPRALSNDDDWQIAAISANGVYAYSSDATPNHAFVTHNGGRSWERVPLDCSEFNAPYTVYTDGHGTLWSVCDTRIEISTDGGSHWVKRHDPRGFDHIPDPLDTLVPISARVAWAESDGDVLRTDDGGRSWQKVLSLPYANIDFDASSATEAQAVGVLRHKDAQGHVLKNLVVYRTTDAGAHWTRTPVTLPSR